jgi:acyl carrier protein phosphodiesterase
MNFLAHFYLVKPAQKERVGCYLGDFYKGQISPELHPEIAAGIRHHRLIDAYSEQSAIFKLSKSHFPNHLRRYAGILVDIIYDHFLARHWEQFHPEKLPIFSKSILLLLEENQQQIPKNGIRFLNYMKQHNLPHAYLDLAMIQLVFYGISTYRFKHENPIMEGFELFKLNYDLFEKDFFEFFKVLESENHAMIDLASQPCNP